MRARVRRRNGRRIGSIALRHVGLLVRRRVGGLQLGRACRLDLGRAGERIRRCSGRAFRVGVLVAHVVRHDDAGDERRCEHQQDAERGRLPRVPTSAWRLFRHREVPYSSHRARGEDFA